MLARMRRWRARAWGRWARLPRWARWVLAGYVIGFAEGTADHVAWMTRGGIHAYAGFGSIAIQAFLVSLIVLDPVAALLCASVRRSGAWLAVLIMALDVPANWADNWPRMPGFLITFLLGELFAVFVFATALPLLRAIDATGTGGRRSRIS